MGSLLGGATQILSKSSSACFTNPPNPLASSAPSGSWPPPTGSSRAVSTQMATPSPPPSSQRHEPRYGCEIQELSG
ncbi:hypothetical protein ACFX13_026940 [Malus domestica]